MNDVHELRATIDRLLDRWEAAASSLQEQTASALGGIAAELSAQKEKVAAAIVELQQAIALAKDLPADVRERLVALLAAVARDVVAAKIATHRELLEQRRRVREAFRDLQECLGRVDRRVVAEIEKAVLRLLLAGKELELTFELLLVRFASAHVDEMVDLAGRMKAAIHQLATFRQALSAGLSAATGPGADVAADIVAQFERASEQFRQVFESLAD